MKDDIFALQTPNISHNDMIREPQLFSYLRIVDHFNTPNQSIREVGIILPVGCGKSGLITITPFATKSKRALVVAPNVRIANQLFNDFFPSSPAFFYKKCKILDKPPFPEPVEIRGTSSNRSDLDDADVVITNIQQLQGEDNRWISSLPPDYFDIILFDEAHHNVAASWEMLKSSFPNASIINFSATPRRADGKMMSGNIIYTYSIVRAIELGYVKKLKAIVLNPRTLKYVRREDGREVEVTLDEVINLGENDSDFRRSIVTSNETLYTIVDASINELNSIRNRTKENRHKIISSALNYAHCIQIKEAYAARGLRADYVHSRENGEYNKKVLEKLNNNELDVIIQVRKLGEGFDHKYLSVAAIFSVFNELSPFIQFVGRIMRVIDQNSPNSPNNFGSVIFHAGANVAKRWEDFQDFSQADQEYFEQLLPLEELNFGNSNELQITPAIRVGMTDTMEIVEQVNVTIEEIPLLIQNDEEAQKAINYLISKGFTTDQYNQCLQAYSHEPIITTKAQQRSAMRLSLDEKVKNEVGKILAYYKINPEGKELDKKFLGKSNFIIIKSTIDRKINSIVNRDKGERSEFSRSELDIIDKNFEQIVTDTIKEVINA